MVVCEYDMLRMWGVIDVAVYEGRSCLFTYVLDEDAGGQVEMGSFLKGLRLI